MYNASMDYLVKQGTFEGPVHLLLELIQGRKLHVSEVSLAVVTDDFLKFISENTLSYSATSSFIVVASTLVLIKARSLVPEIELSEEEESSIEDLTERIRQYQIIQKYSELLAPRYGKQVSLERIAKDTAPVFAPDAQITTTIVSGLLESLLVAFPVLEKLPEKSVKVVVRLEEVIESLSKRIASGVAFHSRDLMDDYRNAPDPALRRQAKVVAVVSFLAILELVKKGIGNVMQNDQFGDIELK
jgi:segregation and condensation protein A